MSSRKANNMFQHFRLKMKNLPLLKSRLKGEPYKAAEPEKNLAATTSELALRWKSAV